MINIKNQVMKKILLICGLLCITAIATHTQARDLASENNCNNHTPGWGESLGRISFITTQTWRIGNQEWSDEVTATHCRGRRDAFSGVDAWTRSYSADCMNLGANHGDLFSWCAVVRFANQLCPSGWRVPTREDFIKLDILLGGNSQNSPIGVQRQGMSEYRSNMIRTVLRRYLDSWGARSMTGGIWGYHGHYWSSSSIDRAYASSMSLDFRVTYAIGGGRYGPFPRNRNPKNFGLRLRCVRTVTPPPNNCNTRTPGWGASLGTVGFVTPRTWTVGSQIWSDAVTATSCQKTTFDGGYGSFNADCRSNPGFGDLFSWCAVVRFQRQLCPYPWRVPTREDFRDLDIAMGGTGDTRRDETPQVVTHNFINRWGGSFGGYSSSIGRIFQQNRWGVYWSLSEQSISNGHNLLFTSGGEVLPQNLHFKRLGYMLRCVRDK